jgi:uncharacterized membrane protein HdeD (DUF308 family)
MYTKAAAKDIWWALVLGGVATVIFGVAAVFWPGLTLVTLLYLFSTYALISGMANVMAGVSSANQMAWWFLPALLGAFELGVGVYLLRHTSVKFSTFILLIGFALIARGVVEAVTAYFSTGRGQAKVQALSYIIGVAGVVAGIIVLFAKSSSGVSFVWIIGLYAIVVGTLQIASVGELTK